MRATDPTFPLFPIFAFLGFVLSVIPLPWHFQAWNSGTCAFMIWVGLLCLIEFINSLIWAGDAINRLPVWCDITSQLIAGAGIGIPASILCISRRLYRIVSTQTVSITRDDKRRAIYQDLAIVIGLPVLVLVLHIIVQPHRFNIFEEYGCSIATYNTLPAVFLYYISPIVIGLVSFVYSALILRTFYVRRIQFNHLFSTNSAINPSRYLRLMLLALMDILCTIPLGIYMVYIDLKSVPLAPWISWADTHFDFGRVELVPAVIWRSSPDSAIAIEINRWTPVFCAFIFFALFGFAEEARKNYRRAFWFVVKPLGFRPTSEKGISGGKGKSGIMSGYVNFRVFYSSASYPRSLFADSRNSSSKETTRMFSPSTHLQRTQPPRERNSGRACWMQNLVRRFVSQTTTSNLVYTKSHSTGILSLLPLRLPQPPLIPLVPR
ncbi:hypothetical protein GYMLUDRAFT_170577 [Collybiopsis luxurians FD-317 M1]|uniref:Pheromone receptor n=1 Tax=Collybiopsis luxurians FD-317 M1 TaxID=944289 RepID=A0A0D0B5V3_9AGAR|nr:hypothetical protein GYMLUDRAFT_170577 [Collybiopsis luxurians FD-317 M1]